METRSPIRDQETKFSKILGQLSSGSVDGKKAAMTSLKRIMQESQSPEAYANSFVKVLSDNLASDNSSVRHLVSQMLDDRADSLVPFCTHDVIQATLYRAIQHSIEDEDDSVRSSSTSIVFKILQNSDFEWDVYKRLLERLVVPSLKDTSSDTLEEAHSSSSKLAESTCGLQALKSTLIWQMSQYIRTISQEALKGSPKRALDFSKDGPELFQHLVSVLEHCDAESEQLPRSVYAALRDILPFITQDLMTCSRSFGSILDKIGHTLASNITVHDEAKEEDIVEVCDDQVEMLTNQVEEQADTQFLDTTDSMGSTLPRSYTDKMARTRTKILQEIESSEKSYMTSLRELISGYYKPLRESGILKPEQIGRMFSNIEAIANFHEVFYIEIQATASVGKTLMKYADFLKMYTQYVNGYDQCIAAMCEMKDVSSFQDFLTKNTKGEPQLMSLLVMPVQRVPRYLLLLRELIENTPTEEEEYAVLKQARDKISVIATHINESKKRVDDFHKVASIQSRINATYNPGSYKKKRLSLIKPTRHLIREGTLFKKSRSGFHKQMQRHFYLFNDALLWTTASTTIPRVKGYIEISQLLFKLQTFRLSGNVETYNVMHIYSKDPSWEGLTIVFESSLQRKQWADDIASAVKAAPSDASSLTNTASPRLTEEIKSQMNLDIEPRCHLLYPDTCNEAIRLARYILNLYPKLLHVKDVTTLHPILIQLLRHIPEMQMSDLMETILSDSLCFLSLSKFDNVEHIDSLLGLLPLAFDDEQTSKEDMMSGQGKQTWRGMLKQLLSQFDASHEQWMKYTDSTSSTQDSSKLNAALYARSFQKKAVSSTETWITGAIQNQKQYPWSTVETLIWCLYKCGLALCTQDYALDVLQCMNTTLGKIKVSNHVNLLDRACVLIAKNSKALHLTVELDAESDDVWQSIVLNLILHIESAQQHGIESLFQCLGHTLKLFPCLSSRKVVFQAAIPKLIAVMRSAQTHEEIRQESWKCLEALVGVVPDTVLWANASSLCSIAKARKPEWIDRLLLSSPSPKYTWQIVSKGSLLPWMLQRIEISAELSNQTIRIVRILLQTGMLFDKDKQHIPSFGEGLIALVHTLALQKPLDSYGLELIPVLSTCILASEEKGEKHMDHLLPFILSLWNPTTASPILELLGAMVVSGAHQGLISHSLQILNHIRDLSVDNHVTEDLKAACLTAIGDIVSLCGESVLDSVDEAMFRVDLALQSNSSLLQEHACYALRETAAVCRQNHKPLLKRYLGRNAYPLSQCLRHPTSPSVRQKAALCVAQCIVSLGDQFQLLNQPVFMEAYLTNFPQPYTNELYTDAEEYVQDNKMLFISIQMLFQMREHKQCRQSDFCHIGSLLIKQCPVLIQTGLSTDESVAVLLLDMCRALLKKLRAHMDERVYKQTMRSLTAEQLDLLSIAK